MLIPEHECDGELIDLPPTPSIAAVFTCSLSLRDFLGASGLKLYKFLIFWLSGRRTSAMEDKERWMELCEQASEEPDPERLLELVQQVNALLDEKETRLKVLPGMRSRIE